MENHLSPVYKKELDQTTLSAYLDELKMVTVIDHENKPTKLNLMIKRDSEIIPVSHMKQTTINGDIYYRLYLNEEIKLGYDYIVCDQIGRKVPLKIGAVVRTMEFDQTYSATEVELGANYTEHFTEFRVWAPTATKVHLELLHNHRGIKLVPMKRLEQGIWTIQLEGDLHNQLYMYKVYVNQTWKEAVDPYAKAVTINGEKGVIVDLTRTNPENWENHHKPEPLQKQNDAVIYELHVRDFSIAKSSGIQNKGKYLAFLENGTKTPNGLSTGIDYVAELGVTHIQLLPIQDFGSVDERAELSSYNWGYDPVHFNVPEGSYSTEPANPMTRITELKKVIMALHEKHLHVILDVVYNHLFQYELSSFEKIVPGYFFRVDYAGNPSNGSGVGNDTASERRMFRKFIKDSVKYWAKEYHVNGFRFDLMGLHDIKTMNEVRNVLDEINPNILLLGEGWELETYLADHEKAIIRNATSMEKMSFFNDHFRDIVKGNTFSEHAMGFVQGNVSDENAILDALIGNANGMFKSPSQSVNYVECHDNHTLWDKLVASMPNESEENLIKRHKMATTIVLFSQGIPFLHAGQEFCRTKQGNNNSYHAPDHINQIDWLRREAFSEYVNFIKKIIELRKSLPLYHLNSKADIEEYVSLVQEDGVVGYQINPVEVTDSWKSMLFLMNNSTQSSHFKIKGNSRWKLIQTGFEVNQAGLCCINEIVEVPALDTVILVN